MLGIPYGFAEAGWLVGLVMLLGSGAMSGFTMHLLSVVSREVSPDGDCTFYRLAAEALPGSWGTALVECTVIANVFGLATSYLVVFGSTMPYVVGSGDNTGAWFTSTYLWVTIALGFVTPLAFAPSLEALSFTSGLGMAAVVYMVLLVLLFAVAPGEDFCDNVVDDDDDSNGGGDDDGGGLLHCGGSVAPAIPQIGLLQLLSIVTFAFTAHVQVLTVANEVGGYTQEKMDSIILGGVALCAVAYTVVGLGGYLAFGDNVNGNILLSYPNSSALVAAARVAISGLVGISYPLMCKPGRDSFLSLLQHSRWALTWGNTRAAYGGFTVSFLLTTYGLAMALVNNPNALDLILSLLGATTSTVIAYVVPTAVYATLHPEPHPKRTAAIAVGCFGAVSMPFCIAATFF